MESGPFAVSFLFFPRGEGRDDRPRTSRLLQTRPPPCNTWMVIYLEDSEQSPKIVPLTTTTPSPGGERFSVHLPSSVCSTRCSSPGGLSGTARQLSGATDVRASSTVRWSETPGMKENGYHRISQKRTFVSFLYSAILRRRHQTYQSDRMLRMLLDGARIWKQKLGLLSMMEKMIGL